MALLLLAACTAASSVRFADQLAAMVRAADDSSAGRALRQGSDYVSFSWEDARGGARTAVLERMDTAICGPQPCWLLTSAAVGRSTTKLIDISEMPELGRINSHVLPLLPTVLVPGEDVGYACAVGPLHRQDDVTPVPDRERCIDAARIGSPDKKDCGCPLGYSKHGPSLRTLLYAPGAVKLLALDVLDVLRDIGYPTVDWVIAVEAVTLREIMEDISVVQSQSWGTGKAVATAIDSMQSIFDDWRSTRATRRASLPSSPVSGPETEELEDEQERTGRVAEMDGAELRTLYKRVCARDHALAQVDADWDTLCKSETRSSERQRTYTALRSVPLHTDRTDEPEDQAPEKTVFVLTPDKDRKDLDEEQSVWWFHVGKLTQPGGQVRAVDYWIPSTDANGTLVRSKGPKRETEKRWAVDLLEFIGQRWGRSWPDVQKAVAALGLELAGGSRKSIVALAPGDLDLVTSKLKTATFTALDAVNLQQRHMQLMRVIYKEMVQLPFGLEIIAPVTHQGVDELKRIREQASAYQHVTAGAGGSVGGCTDPAYFQELLFEHVPELMLLDGAPESVLVEFFDGDITFDLAKAAVATAVAFLGLPQPESMPERFGKMPDGAACLTVKFLNSDDAAQFQEAAMTAADAVQSQIVAVHRISINPLTMNLDGFVLYKVRRGELATTTAIEFHIDGMKAPQSATFIMMLYGGDDDAHEFQLMAKSCGDNGLEEMLNSLCNSPRRLEDGRLVVSCGKWCIDTKCLVGLLGQTGIWATAGDQFCPLCNAAESQCAESALTCGEPRGLTDGDNWRIALATELKKARWVYESIAIVAALAQAKLNVPAAIAELAAAAQLMEDTPASLGSTNQHMVTVDTLNRCCTGWNHGSGITAELTGGSVVTAFMQTVKEHIRAVKRSARAWEAASLADQLSAETHAEYANTLRSAAEALQPAYDAVMTAEYLSLSMTFPRGDFQDLLAGWIADLEHLATTDWPPADCGDDCDYNPHLQIAVTRLTDIHSELTELAEIVATDGELIDYLQMISFDKGVQANLKGQHGFRVMYNGRHLLLFHDDLYKEYMQDDGLANWHYAPLWPAVNPNMGVVFDAPLHAFHLRSLIAMHWAKIGIVLPQRIDVLTAERAKDAVDITVAGADAWKLTLPNDYKKSISCVIDIAGPSIDIAENTFVKPKPGEPPPLKIRQPGGHSAMNSLKVEHSIAVCYPPALAVPISLLEASWRYMGEILYAYAPLEQFDIPTCGVMVVETKLVLQDIVFWSERLIVPEQRGTSFRSMSTPSVHMILNHMTDLMKQSPRCAFEHSTVSAENQHKLARLAQMCATAGAGVQGLCEAVLNVYMQTMTKTNNRKIQSLKHGAPTLKRERKRQVKARAKRKPLSLHRREGWRLAHAAKLKVCGGQSDEDVSISFGANEAPQFVWSQSESPPPWQPVCDWKTGFGACPETWGVAEMAVPPASLYCMTLRATTGMCKDNSQAQGQAHSPPEPDVICNEGRLRTDAASTPRGDGIGPTDAAAQEVCCVVAAVTGKCAGNSDPAEDVVCGSGLTLRANPSKLRRKVEDPTAELAIKSCCKKMTKAQLRAQEEEEEAEEEDVEEPEEDDEDDAPIAFDTGRGITDAWKEGLTDEEIAAVEASREGYGDAEELVAEALEELLEDDESDEEELDEGNGWDELDESSEDV